MGFLASQKRNMRNEVSGVPWGWGEEEGDKGRSEGEGRRAKQISRARRGTQDRGCPPACSENSSLELNACV